MSRYCAEHDSEKTLEAAAHWRRQALETDGSVFTALSLWHLSNLESLDQYFINNYDDGEGNFISKFEKQLAQTEPGVKQLAAEILWLMFLCPSNITPDKKREVIQTIWEWSGEALPKNLPWLTDEYIAGVGSAGTGFNTNRWRELVYIIRVLIAFKKLTKAERQRLLADGATLAEWLEQIPENEARQFRHMLLFLLFPDDFERIFGGTDRVRVVTAFTGKSNSQVKANSAREIDRELLAIRHKQEEIYGQQEIDFYEPPLRELWGESRNVSWLLSWNPTHWTWENFSQDRAATHQGKTVPIRWSCNSRKPVVGDKAYLLRTGVPPKGIIAAGNIVTAPYEAPDWDDEKAAQGKTRWYVDVAFSRIQDPLTKDPYVSENDLAKITVDQQVWTPQSSGIEIKTHSAGVLKKLWDNVVKATPQPKGVIKSLEIADPVNLIYFGPPGTGKTYALSKLFEKYTSEKQNVDQQAWLVQQLLDARWFDVIFAALVDLGERAKVAQIAEHEFITLKALAMGRTRHVRQTVWAILQEHARENSNTVHYKKRNSPLVFDKEEDSIWALVDDWREEGEDQVAMAKFWRQGPQMEAVQQRYEMVTFHQAYSYEDFVEGIRPGQDDESGELVYRVVPAVFRRLCQKAKTDPKHRYAIFIDEINRGNIAKIFGELITLIEDDKRTIYKPDGSLESGLELTLPYSGDRFGVPKNLDVYGAMNTADRSIALLDTALRRRFKFEELMPQAGLINGSRGDGYIEDGEGGIINLRALLEAVNRRIRFLLNRDMTLGHSYLMKVQNFSALKDVMLHKIIPLLQEYFYEDWHRIQLVFRDIDQLGNPLEPQIISHTTMNEEEVLGFDHDAYENMVEYQVEKDNVTPTSIRKIYEKSN
jgi:hypothetical protein